MAFDTSTRARLARFVAEVRDLLAEEFTDKLRLLYGISPSGETAPVETLPDLDEPQRATAQLLRDRLAHLIAANPSGRNAAAAAVARLTREQAFTILNRLAAVRLAEKRGLVAPSLAQGYESAGFRQFLQVAGTALGETFHRYRRYLFCLFDELAVDLGVLFDRRSPSGLLFPREPALLKLLEKINAPDLDQLWAEDETIGWIYQYWNDPAERKRMREESAAPRNSRELAVRNQFFTPRYVVEFLTDNTLGRIWYEMTRGNTRLKDQCRYLVRRPNERFLKPGEQPPSPPSEGEEGRREVGAAPSQEDLLKQPVHIPHRPLKDPRAILMLDPACGSMHFGLYAFDLFQVIYEEAWDIAKSGAIPAGADASFAPFVAFVSSFPSREAFLREVPRLIIEHDVHGIDIDPRCAQIAALSLWLRAHRAWKDQKISATDRPRITRSNIVCAEPMPGEKHLLKGFVEEEFSEQKRPIFLRLLETIFEKMQLAGEAGSLLKIEEEIRTALDNAKQEWQKLQQRPSELFPTAELNRATRKPEFDLTPHLQQITGDFWENAETRLLDALRAYAEQAESGAAFQRRLFAEDAARGFALIDVCRKRYDIALMNPPFGEPTEDIEPYLAKHYTRTKNNLYCAFLQRQLELCPRGLVGLISARTFVMYRDFENFRRDLLLGSSRILTFADLGWEVLDGAQVETAAFALVRNNPTDDKPTTPLGPFFRLLDTPVEDKGASLLRACSDPNEGKQYLVTTGHFFALPGAPLAYWASQRLVEVFSKSATFQPSLAYCGRGAAAHVFFFRLAWEIPIANSTAENWKRLAHGGEYSPFFRENSVFIDWEDNGRKVKEYILKQYPYLNGNFGWAIQDEDKYGLVGLTSGKRNERFNVQLMPAGHIFTNEGQGFIPNDTKDVWFALGYLNSSLVSYFLALTSGLQKTWVYIRPVPVVALAPETRTIVETAAEQSFRIKQRWSAGAEESALFVTVWPLINGSHESLPAMAKKLIAAHSADSAALNHHREELSAAIISAIKPTSEDKAEIAEDFKRHPADLAFPTWRDCDAPTIEHDLALRLTSYLVGIAFGRWDIRYAQGQKTATLPPPFAQLPACPLGQLQNHNGLPVRQQDLPAGYPIKTIPWNGILLDHEGHELDLPARIRQGIELIWGADADTAENEICKTLAVKSIRDYLRKPSGFFADHLRNYSKNRRQAPIYLPLSTPSGSYTVWLYYHRLTDQTLHSVLADFVDLRIKDLDRTLTTLREQGKGGSKAAELQDLLDELKQFHAEIERVIKLPWKPDLNDGVLITACPLWKLFRLPKWRKDLEACWNDLEAGEHDWAHLAYSIWPDRVREKCRTDRSLAVAHSLEPLCQASAPAPKAKRGRKKQADLQGLEE